MAMSKDRVHFILRDNSCNHAATTQAAVAAFGLTPQQVNSALKGFHPVRVICRPSQFARFLIYRSQEVSNNAFAQFEAKLQPADCDAVVDVSGHQAQGN